jgi:hypothetical protein
MLADKSFDLIVLTARHRRGLAQHCLSRAPKPLPSIMKTTKSAVLFRNFLGRTLRLDIACGKLRVKVAICSQGWQLAKWF